MCAKLVWRLVRRLLLEEEHRPVCYELNIKLAAKVEKHTMSNANASGGGAIADKDEYARRRDRRSIQVYLLVATLANIGAGVQGKFEATDARVLFKFHL